MIATDNNAQWENRDFHDLYDGHIESSRIEEEPTVSPFANIDISCDYTTPDEFKTMSSSLDYPSTSLFCINCQSLNSHLDELHDLIVSMSSDKFMFDFIGIVETFQLKPDINYSLEGYQSLIYRDRTEHGRNGGGVGMYIRDNIQFEIRKDLSVFEPFEFESIFIETTINSKPAIIGNIYRPPNGDIENFIGTLTRILRIAQAEKKSIFLMGDYNIDLLKFDRHNGTLDYIEELFSLSVIPLISKPTRVRGNAATLIDHMYTDMLDKHYNCGIVITDIADHFGTYCIIELNPSSYAREQQVSTRSFSADNIITFRNLIMAVDFTSVTSQQCPNVAYDTLMAHITASFNVAFPLRQIRLRKKFIKRKPWCTQGIMVSAINKDKLYHKKLKSPTDANTRKYKDYCSLYYKTVRESKISYYTNLFETHKHNIKKTWSALRDIINRSAKSNSIPTAFLINDRKVCNPQEISEEFNNYFSTIGQKLSDNVTGPDFQQYLRGNHPNSMFVNPVTEVEILNSIAAIKPKTSQGHDGISSKILKKIADLISQPLSHVFNKSLSAGIFPKNMKTAKVVPVFKSGRHDLLNNYRPISILPALSKILEKLMCTRLLDFLEHNHILYEHQYGFRKKHNTVQPIIQMLRYISEHNDLPSKEFTSAIFLDLSKAFDCISHNILLRKLNHYGIRGTCHSWFESYLSNRSQFTEINNIRSSLRFVTCGVPQGSILGPILFLLYVNDINSCTSLNILCYADDTTAFSSSSCRTTLEAYQNSELGKLNTWFKSNKLSLNVGKTKYSIYSPGRKPIPNLSLNIDNIPIERDSTFKFLGLTVDEKLTWKDHICKLRAKLASSLFIINRVKRLLPLCALRNIYFTLFHSHLNYGISLWGASPHVEQISKLQKKAIRLIRNARYSSHTDRLFLEERILKVRDIHSVQCAMFMRDFINNELPGSFDHFFPDVTNYNILTRNRAADYVNQTRPRTKFSAHLPNHSFPANWNSIGQHLKNIPTRNAFKKMLSADKFSHYLVITHCNYVNCPDCRIQT